MAVYVDEPIHPFGRMLMCHMLADTTDELNAMADAIGVPRRWIQKAGTPYEHFDICKAKRAKAIAHGAIEKPARELAVWRRKRIEASRVQHVCGLQGFGALGDRCPACEQGERSGQ